MNTKSELFFLRIFAIIVRFSKHKHVSIPSAQANVKTRQDKINQVKISFPPDVFFVSGLRDFVGSMARTMAKLDGAWVFRIQLIVDELCNNAVEHGSEIEDGEVHLELKVTPGKRLDIVVEDRGVHPLKADASEIEQRVKEKHKKHAIADWESVRGRGLSHIVLPLVDELEFIDLDDGGLRAHITKYLSDNKESTTNNE